jgi:hypothetical protein
MRHTRILPTDLKDLTIFIRNRNFPMDITNDGMARLPRGLAELIFLCRPDISVVDVRDALLSNRPNLLHGTKTV